MSLGTIFGNLFAHAAEVETEGAALVGELESIFSAVAHGEGGAQKVAKVAALASQVAMTASNIAAKMGTPAAAPAAAP